MYDVELTAEKINEYIKEFTPIYNEKGKEINPIPTNQKVTVWCDGGNPEYSGFACNMTGDEIGLASLIAKSWIYETKLQKLLKK